MFAVEWFSRSIASHGIASCSDAQPTITCIKNMTLLCVTIAWLRNFHDLPMLRFLHPQSLRIFYVWYIYSARWSCTKTTFVRNAKLEKAAKKGQNYKITLCLLIDYSVSLVVMYWWRRMVAYNCTKISQLKFERLTLRCWNSLESIFTRKMPLIVHCVLKEINHFQIHKITKWLMRRTLTKHLPEDINLFSIMLYVTWMLTVIIVIMMHSIRPQHSMTISTNTNKSRYDTKIFNTASISISIKATCSFVSVRRIFQHHQ